MAKEYTHRDLIVWQKAQDLAHQMIRLTHRLPQSWANAVIARQIISAATAIGANIAEGHGRYSPGAHGNHLEIAKGSAAETDSWSDMLRREEYVSAEEDADVHAVCTEIMTMLKAKILALEQLEQQGGKKVREEQHSYSMENHSFPFNSEDYI